MSEVVSIDPYTGERVFAAPSAAPPPSPTRSARRPRRNPRGRRATIAPGSCRAFAAAVEGEADRLADLLVREVGKRRIDAEGEVAWTSASARWYADHPPQEEAAGGARVLRRPVGVVAAITPWNVPLITPAWKWLPALVAGNAVVWKPSERATAVAVAAAELLHAAGVPAARSSSRRAATRRRRRSRPTSGSGCCTSPAQRRAAARSPRSRPPLRPRRARAERAQPGGGARGRRPRPRGGAHRRLRDRARGAEVHVRAPGDRRTRRSPRR